MPGSIRLHSGIMTKDPSLADALTGPNQSLGLGFEGSVALKRHCDTKFESGTRSRNRSTSVSLSHINPSNADVGVAILSATLHSTVDTVIARPECTSRLRRTSSPKSSRGALDVATPNDLIRSSLASVFFLRRSCSVFCVAFSSASRSSSIEVLDGT